MTVRCMVTECYVPLHPDPPPPPERLQFLHAPRYSTSLGMFETNMPEWAAEGWKWQRASGGGSVMYVVYVYVLLSRTQITV